MPARKNPPTQNGPNKRRRKTKTSEDEEDPDVPLMADGHNASSAELDVSLSREHGFDENGELPPGALKYRDLYIAPPPPSACSFDTKGPRLIIKTLVVNNFKSFYGSHTIGPFFKGMSAVIGPNGSGKSNVLDAILFVFGYRASKIRTKKVSMLIHSSTNYTDLQSCSVTVNFVQIIDKGPTVDPEEVPNSELVVSRTAMRDNNSYYTMDGRRVQFKDVETKLRSHGIDLTNGRFLILQGEVEQIAQMKPKGETEQDVGLLEFLEDVIGTLRYREPLAKAQVIDGQLEEIREAQAEKVNTAEKNLRVLEEAKDIAVAFLETENQLIRLNHQILQKNNFDLEQKIVAESERKTAVTEKMDEIKKELEDVHARHKEVETKTKAKREQVDQLKQKKDKLDKTYKSTQKRDMELQENLTSHATRRKKMMEGLKSEQKKLTDLKALPEKNTREIGELEALVTRHEKDRTTNQAALLKASEGLQKETAEPQAKLEGLEAELATLAKQREEKAAANKIDKSKLEIATKAERQQQEKLENLTKSLEEAKTNLTTKTKRVSELEREVPAARQKLAEVSEQLERERNERHHMDERLRKHRAELEGARVAAESARHRNRVVAALMKECAAGNIPGVFGRLGDLGGIDSKYDCAISSSCGSLDHIVVDKVDTGERCINYLRDTGVGRANFLVLEKLQHWGLKALEKIDPPENVPRLFDLVKVEDQRVLPAFYFALRDTLVANDIEQATRIGLGGRKRYRVVDLKGNIVEPGGTITGGGAPIRGKMGTRATAGLVNEQQQAAATQTPQLRDQIESLQRRSSELMQSIIKLEQAEREAKNAVPPLEAELRRLKMDVQQLKDSVPNLERQVKDQREVASKTSSDKKEVKRLQDQVAKSTQELEEAAGAASKIETQVERLRKQIDDIKNTRVGGLDAKVKELNKKITKAHADKNKLSAAISSCERNMQKCNEKIADLQQEISGLEEEMKAMKAEMETVSEKAKGLLEERASNGEAVLECEEQLEELRSQQKKIGAEDLAVRKRVIEVEQELEKFDAQIKNHKARQHENNKRMKGMKLEDIPGKGTLEPLKMYTEEELAEIDPKDLVYSVQTLEGLKPKERPNMAIIDEYRTKEDQFIAMVKDLEDAAARRNEARQFLTEGKRARYAEFMRGFQVINQKLKEVFRMISMGGDAELELQDTFNPFLEGVAFSVRPRNKAWTQIDRLSGGEKTLSSLALVFGLHYFKPSPFYMMDEIDAALDVRNVSIIGHYITQFTTNCQFIVISLRPEMYDLFERRVVGVYKPDGCSRSVALDPIGFRNTPHGDLQSLFVPEPKETVDETQVSPSPTSKRPRRRVGRPNLNESLDKEDEEEEEGRARSLTESPEPKRVRAGSAEKYPAMSSSNSESEEPSPKRRSRAKQRLPRGVVEDTDSSAMNSPMEAGRCGSEEPDK